jgi:YidC/Oxa1 family membrane protein insertase
MIGQLFHLAVYQPLYNGLIFLLDILPWADAGVAIIIFTCLVKLILFPFSQKSVKEQLKMKETNQELNSIKEKYKDNKEAQAQAIMAFYKEKKINPFSGILLLFIQLPIIWALYSIFLRGGLPHIKAELLYFFVGIPTVSMNFLGLIDITQKSILLALLASITQYFQFKFSTPPTSPKSGNSFQDALTKSMSLQMKIVFPVLIFFVAYNYSGVVALYLLTSNLFAVGQELYVRRSLVQAPKNA